MTTDTDIENEMNKASIEVVDSLYRNVLKIDANDFVNLFRIRIAKIWCEQMEKEATSHMDADIVLASDELMRSVKTLKGYEGRAMAKKIKGEQDLDRMYR